MVIDSISNLIIKLQNASRAKQESTSVAYSKFNGLVLDVLKRLGYIKDYTKKGKKIIKTADVVIAYEENGAPKITQVKRLSKLSKRVYKGSDDIRSVRQGFGHLIISTSKGVMTGGEAKKLKIGGEVLFKIW